MIQLLKKYQEYVILGVVVLISLIVGWMSAQTTFIEEQVSLVSARLVWEKCGYLSYSSKGKESLAITCCPRIPQTPGTRA